MDIRRFRRLRIAVTTLLALTALGAEPARAACAPSSDTLCLLEGRFSATLRWNDGSGFKDAFVAGPKTDGAASASGLFYFYDSDPSNWEILTKMINGCGTNDRFWVLTAASTGFGWELAIKDEATGTTRTFTHPLNGQASGIADFGAFDTCGSNPPPPSPTPVPNCPTNGPLTDLRKNCSDYIYLYLSPNRLVGAGLTSSGSIAAICITDGDSTICAGGPVVSAVRANLVQANADGGPFSPLDPGSYVEIRNSGRALDLRLILDGERYDFFGFQYAQTDPLLSTGESAMALGDARVANVRNGLDAMLRGGEIGAEARATVGAALDRISQSAP